MIINKEVEAKALLKKDDYNKVVNYFNFNKNNQIIQTNFYFDTEDLMFQNHRIVVRIRYIKNNDKYELTAKLRQRDGSSIELNQIVTYKDFMMTMSRGILPKGEIKDKLKLIIKTKKVMNIASLTTYRYEIKYDDGILALDENHYSNIIDYELEFEGENMAGCVTTIKNLLNEIGIDFTINKMGKRARAFMAAQKERENKK